MALVSERLKGIQGKSDRDERPAFLGQQEGVAELERGRSRTGRSKAARRHSAVEGLSRRR